MTVKRFGRANNKKNRGVNKGEQRKGLGTLLLTLFESFWAPSIPFCVGPNEAKVCGAARAWGIGKAPKRTLFRVIEFRTCDSDVAAFTVSKSKGRNQCEKNVATSTKS